MWRYNLRCACGREQPNQVLFAVMPVQPHCPRAEFRMTVRSDAPIPHCMAY